MILDFSYHSFCGHKYSQYRYIAISVETLGGGVSVKLLFTLFIEFFFFTQ